MDNKYNCFQEKFDELVLDFKDYKEIRSSFADNTSKYRNFSKEIDIDYQIIKKLKDNMLYKLLIDFYTLSEQLIKKCIFSLLWIEEDQIIENPNINKYLNNKFPSNRYSPGVKIKDIDSNLNQYKYHPRKYIFIKYNKYIHNYKSYDDMVTARHSYAHTGHVEIYDLYDTLENTLVILEFLICEISIFEYKHEQLMFIQENLIETNENIKKIKNKRKQKGNYKKYNNYLEPTLKCLQNIKTNFIDIKNDYEIKSEIYKNMYDEVLNTITYIQSINNLIEENNNIANISLDEEIDDYIDKIVNNTMLQLKK